MTEQEVPQTGEQAAFMHDLNELIRRHKPVGIAVATFFPAAKAEEETDTVLAVFGLPGGDSEAERSRALYTLARMMEVTEARARTLAAKLLDMDSSITDGATRIIRREDSPGGLQ